MQHLPTGHCDRSAFLVDAKEYFHAVGESIRRAERSVLILGWDIDSRIRLDRDQDKQFYELLNEAVEARPDLQIHVLIWHYPLAYSKGREFLQQLNFPRKTHRNIHFHLDSEMPLGSSHHQKVVVIDDKVAYQGGMDLTNRRWDTREHMPENPARTTPGGATYNPYHDVQMVVDGEMAVMLGDMARQRWLWATDHQLSPPGPTTTDPWPDSVEPLLRDKTMAMALTLPPFRGREERREIETLYLWWISRAKETIYIENQYLTSSTISRALARRLDREDCPEILIILTKLTSGLLERLVMEPLESDVLDHLAERDVHNKLKVYCPYAERDPDIPIKVHSKLMVVDDQFITVGSANLNERSMGLDSECNLALEGSKDVLRGLRRELIAHLLGVNAKEYAAREKETGMLKAVKALRGETGRLVPEPETRDQHPLPVGPELARPLDSSRPSQYDSAMDGFSGESSKGNFLRYAAFGALLAAFITMALIWRDTSLANYENPNVLLQWTHKIRTLPLAPLLAILAYVVGGFVMFPVMLLIILTASIFPPFEAVCISLAGSMLSAMAVYYTGHILGHGAVKRVSGSRVHSISKQLGRHGLISIILTRIVPVAPFSILNLVAGASHIRLTTFLWGTLIGMGPGIVLMTVFGTQLSKVIQNPGAETVLWLGLIVMAILVIGVAVRKRLKHFQDSDPEDDQ